MTNAAGSPEYDLFAEFYDHVVAYRERPDVAFFVDLARAAGGPVLEVGCGTGRVLIPIAQAGVEITGLDLSEGMLAVCRAKLRQEAPEVQARVRLHHGDMRDFHLDRTFPLVTVPFRAFQHLMSVEDQRRALRGIRAHLTDGGRLVLDLFNPSIPFLADDRWTREPIPEPGFTLPDGRHVVRKMRIAHRDLAAQTQQVEMVYEVAWPDGRTERSVGHFDLRYLFRFEAEHLLELERFAVEAVYGGYDRGPFGAEYPGELILVAAKG